MNERYYDWLRSIDPRNMNAHKIVAMDRLPFNSAMDAIAFVSKHFPEVEPADHAILVNPARSRELASVSQYEVQYLIQQLETLSDDLRNLAAKQLTRPYDAPEHPESLYEQVQREVAEQYSREYLNQAIGVNQAITKLRSRLYELQTLAGNYATQWRL